MSNQAAPSRSQLMDDFRDAMRSGGVPYVGEINGDGVLHRIYVEGDRKGSRNGWYVYYDDAHPNGAFGTKKGDSRVKWSPERSVPLTREERRARDEKMAADKARRAEEERLLFAAAAERANKMWEAGAPATDHPYLRAKGVAAHGLRIGDWWKERKEDGKPYLAAKNALLIPLKDGRNIVSLQAIFAEPLKQGEQIRTKDFVFGGKKRGCWFTIGKPTEIDGRVVVVICEGYATGASIHQATGLGVVVAFDGGNLQPVAEAVRRLMKEARIIIAGDNDQWTMINQEPVNVGVQKATAAAASCRGEMVIPTFANLKTQPTDYNDLAAIEGEGELRRQIMAVVSPPAPEPEQPPHIEDGPDYEPFDPGEYVNPDDNGIEPPDVEEDDLDTAGYFRILGHDRDRLYIYQYRMKLILSRGMADWSDKAMMMLAPLQWWEGEFPGDKGMNVKMAHNWLLRSAEKKGFFDPNCRRGRGAWRDDGRIVYHFGDRLMVDAVLNPDLKINSSNVYEQARRLRPPADDPLSGADGRKIIELSRLFHWSRPASAILWAGWCALAPVCGALIWRPHVWVTGGAGSGKTTVLSVANWLMNGAAIYAQGNSTEAGIRQTLKMDALPVLFDESEQNNDRETMRVQAVLALIRQSSTESEAKTLKGTQGGEAQDFMIRSMFHLSSIQVGMKQQADFERVSILALKPKREDGQDSKEQASKNWSILKAGIDGLKADGELPARMLRRSLALLPTTLMNIEIFAQAAAEKFGSQREGDQYGTMIAGAWSLISSKLATLDEARAMIDRYDWSDYLENSETEESSKALGSLMEARLRLPRGAEVNVYELVAAAAGRSTETCDVSMKEADSVLRRYGMQIKWVDGKNPANAVLLVSNNSGEPAKLLADTPYAADVKGQLLRVPGAYRHGPEKFHGSTSRSVGIPLVTFVDGLVAPQAQMFPDDIAF